MPKPGVSTEVRDLTNRVNSTGTYNAGIVIAAKKGPIDTPVLVTSQTQLLREYAPDETMELGWDTAFEEAFIYLGQQSNLYVVRAAHTKDLANADDDYVALYGGAKIMLYKSKEDHATLTEGFATEDEAPFDDYDNIAFIIYGADQGEYNNDIAVEIVTDPDTVNLDGAFLLNVYKKARTSDSYTQVESFTCSLNPSLKNGYGVNCFIETALMASNYVRAVVNDDVDILQDTSYQVNISGSVTFDNTVIKTKDTVRANHEYKVGDIVKVAELSTSTAFYECTKAGRTADTDERPAFSSADEYITTVEDGKATWTKREVVKQYAVGADYLVNDIIQITIGASTYSFRALVSGTTGDIQPQWVDENNVAYDTVQDGTITWTNQTQTEVVSELVGYTFKSGIKNEKLDLKNYEVYEDMYLAKQLELPSPVSVEDPTQVAGVVVQQAVTYTATYTGAHTQSHYTLPKETTELVPLGGGSDGSAVLDSDRIRALDTFRNKEIVVNLIMDGGNCTAAYHRAIDDVCTAKKNACHGIISVPYEYSMGLITGDKQADTVSYRTNVLNANTQNLELFAPHQLVYDQFNDRNMYVSPGCYVAARIMDVAQTSGWHWAAAGYTRGIINSLDVATTYDDTIIDTFSDKQINTIVKEAGSGNIIMDELTMLSKASDLQEAHISRYINIYLRPNLEESLKSFLFEFNDEETRVLIVKMLDNFLKTQTASRALQDYYVVCDETNNLPADIQNNICNVWVFVKPTKCIKFLKQVLIISEQGADLADIEF